MKDIGSLTTSRRAFLGGTVAATGGLILAGCTSKASPSASGGAGDGSAVKALRIGITGDVLLSGLQRFQESNISIRRTVFDYMIDKNPDGSYRPALATAWEWSKDLKTLVITLRDGVTFHTGRAFGPDDIIASVQAALDPKSGAQASGLLALASSMKKTGNNQLTVTFDTPFPSYLDAYAMLPIIDKETYASVAGGKNVIGTGPYTWKSWTAGSKYEMAKNGSYWQEGKPYFDSLSFSVIADPQAILAAMQSGQLDLVEAMVARDAATLQKDSRFAVGTSTSYDIYVGVNTAIKPLDDIRVRQAIAYSLDRDRIVSQIYSGLAEPSSVPWATNTPGVTKDMLTRYSYNVDKAKALLQEAGAAGAEIAVTPFVADKSVAAIQDIVLFGLTQIGLKPKPVSYDAAGFATHLQQGQFPGLWISNVALTAMGPVTTLLTANPLTIAKNTSNFVTPEYQSLAKAVTNATSADMSAAVTALTNYMLEQAFHNTVVQGASDNVAVKGLTGVTTDLTKAVDLTNAKLSK